MPISPSNHLHQSTYQTSLSPPAPCRSPKVSQVPQPIQRGTSGSNSSSSGGKFLNFLSETKSKVVNAFMKPAPNNKFPYTPFTPPKGTLNHVPFQSSSSSSGDRNGTDAWGDVDQSSVVDLTDLDLLDRQVTQLEKNISDTLHDGQGNDKNGTNSQNPTPVNVQGLDDIFSPINGDLSKDRIPASIYAELIALYDQDLNGMGRGICGSGICCTGIPETPPTTANDQEKNKDRNVRREVLKWNKDKN